MFDEDYKDGAPAAEDLAALNYSDEEEQGPAPSLNISDASNIEDLERHHPQKEPCLLYLSEISLEDGSEIERVECLELSTHHVFRISGISQDELLSQFDVPLSEDQAPTLMQEGAYFDEETATLVLDPDHLETVQYGLYEDEDAHQFHRKLTGVGQKRVLVVRVNGNDASFPLSERDLWSNWFSTSKPSFKSQMEDCSYGNYRVVEAKADTVRINRNIRGVRRETIENAARDAALSQITRNLWSTYDHVAFCLPEGTINDDGGENWVAYASVGRKKSVYNGSRYCSLAAIQMHGK